VRFVLRSSRTRNTSGRLADSQLDILSGDASVYRAFAADYFDVQVPLDAISHVLAGQPLSKELVARISSERSFDDLASDLAEIGYGT